MRKRFVILGGVAAATLVVAGLAVLAAAPLAFAMGASGDLHKRFAKVEGVEAVELVAQEGTDAASDARTVSADPDDVSSSAVPCGPHDLFGLGKVPPGLTIRADEARVDVIDGGPADRAGVETGDVIAAVDGTAVASAAEVADAIRQHAPGDVVTVGVKRGEERVDVEVELGTHPDDETRAFLGVMLGGPVTIRALPLPRRELRDPADLEDLGQLEDMFGLHGELFGGQADFEGTLVSAVEDGGPAAEAGIERGDVLIAVADADVTTPQDAVAALEDLEPGEQVTVTVRGADGDERAVDVILGRHPADEDRAYLGVRLGYVIRSMPPSPDEVEGWLEELGLPDLDGDADEDSVPRRFRFRLPDSQAPGGGTGSGTA